jgi:hypothetical protein
MNDLCSIPTSACTDLALAISSEARTSPFDPERSFTGLLLQIQGSSMTWNGLLPSALAERTKLAMAHDEHIGRPVYLETLVRLIQTLLIPNEH